MPSAFMRVATLAALLVLTSALGALPAQASCDEAVPLSESTTNAQTVFVGTVTELDFDSRVATFTIDEIWKGKAGATTIVVGGSALPELQGARAIGQNIATSVDRSYELGVTYLVVSHGSKDEVLLDNRCSNTQAYPGISLRGI